MLAAAGPEDPDPAAAAATPEVRLEEAEDTTAEATLPAGTREEVRAAEAPKVTEEPLEEKSPRAEADPTLLAAEDPDPPPGTHLDPNHQVMTEEPASPSPPAVKRAKSSTIRVTQRTETIGSLLLAEPPRRKQEPARPNPKLLPSEAAE